MSESNAPPVTGESSAAVTDDLVVADYRLGRRVGTDIYGDIYVGTRDGAHAVVTLLHDRIVIDVLAARRFASEMDLVADLTPWGVIPTLDFDFETQPRWIASSSASGQLLRQRLAASGPMQPAAVRLLASQLARALQALHARGVTQRDLSPDSVLLGASSAALWHSGWAGLLDGSEYAGTLHTEHVEWLAPEQFTGDPTGPASDIHAWAVTVLYAATGHNPFEAEKASTSVSRLMRDTPIIPAVFDPVLASLIAGALAKNPQARPTARDLVTFLDPGAPLLEPSAPMAMDDVPAHGVETQAEAGSEVAPPETVDLQKHPRETASVDLTPAVVARADEDVEDVVALEAQSDGDGDGHEFDDDIAASLDHADEDEWEIDAPPTGRRIGLAPLVGLGVIVVAVGSVVGLVVGRLLGG